MKKNEKNIIIDEVSIIGQGYGSDIKEKKNE